MARRKRSPESSIGFELSMLHLSGLGWADALAYMAARDRIDLSHSEIAVLACAAECALQVEFMKTTRHGQGRDRG